MTTIAFLGAGNIAQAIMGGLVENGLPADSLVAHDPVPELMEKAASLGVSTLSSNDDAVSRAEIIMLCVKPNVVIELLQALKGPVEGKVFVSVAAGITLDQMQAALPQGAALIRCMPNTPALVQSGMTGMYAIPEVSEGQKQAAEKVMSAVGECLWVDAESDLDAVTAVSGSGPAYYFLMMEAMIEAAESEGLSRSMASRLVLQTALGAARMACDSDVSPDVLRERVTSPGGTTKAALDAFGAGNFKGLVNDAVHAARVRSVELSNG